VQRDSWALSFETTSQGLLATSVPILSLPVTGVVDDCKLNLGERQVLLMKLRPKYHKKLALGRPGRNLRNFIPECQLSFQDFLERRSHLWLCIVHTYDAQRPNSATADIKANPAKAELKASSAVGCSDLVRNGTGQKAHVCADGMVVGYGENDNWYPLGMLRKFNHRNKNTLSIA